MNLVNKDYTSLLQIKYIQFIVYIRVDCQKIIKRCYEFIHSLLLERCFLFFSLHKIIILKVLLQYMLTNV